MELDCLVIYTLRKHEKPENRGLSNLYGEAPNAIKAARDHFDRMIKACERNVPENGWLFGKRPSVADIMFTSCLMHCDRFKIEIKSKKVMFLSLSQCGILMTPKLGKIKHFERQL